MAEALVIRLHPDAARFNGEWLLVDTAGTRLGNVQSGPLADALPLATGRRVVVLVPGTDVVLASPELPKAGARLAQLVPFALEEQLASDVEDMHFAVGRRSPSEPGTGTPVAAASRAAMDAWLASLRLARITPHALLSEAAAVPVTPNGVTLLIEGFRIHVRRPGVPAAVVEAEPLIEGLQLALAAGPDTRESVTLYMSALDYERDKEMVEELREFTGDMQVKLLADGTLPLLAVTAMTQPATNLLQGVYAPPSSLKVSFAPWRYAAMLAGVLVAAHAGVKALEYARLSTAEAQLDQELSATFGEVMPGTREVDARRQVEARLAQLRGGGAASGLLAGLGVLSDALGEAPGTRIETLSYRANTLDLRVLAPDVSALDKIQHSASERGVNAEIQSATPREQRIEGRLQLKTPT